MVMTSSATEQPAPAIPTYPDLIGKVAVVRGGSSGIGTAKSCCEQQDRDRRIF
jgi:NADP-dependent 3-hydroxy acid dehydrogenase YdfG